MTAEKPFSMSIIPTETRGRREAENINILWQIHFPPHSLKLHQSSGFFPCICNSNCSTPTRIYWAWTMCRSLAQWWRWNAWSESGTCFSRINSGITITQTITHYTECPYLHLCSQRGCEQTPRGSLGRIWEGLWQGRHTHWPKLACDSESNTWGGQPPSCGHEWKLLSHIQLFATPWITQSTEFSRPEYWSG